MCTYNRRLSALFCLLPTLYDLFMNTGRAQPLGVTASHYAFPASTGMAASLNLYISSYPLPSLFYICPIVLSWPAIDYFLHALMYIFDNLLYFNFSGGFYVGWSAGVQKEASWTGWLGQSPGKTLHSANAPNITNVWENIILVPIAHVSVSRPVCFAEAVLTATFLQGTAGCILKRSRDSDSSVLCTFPLAVALFHPFAAGRAYGAQGRLTYAKLTRY